MTLVVDASAIAAVLFAEPNGDTIRAHVRGESLLAPHLIDYELANICLKRIRREPMASPGLLTMLSGLTSLGIRRVDVPPTEVAALAVQTGLTAYDASYLWLAVARDIELVTLDSQLARVNQALRERYV
jgi:predicted nucleic acid-binding protein